MINMRSKILVIVFLLFFPAILKTQNSKYLTSKEVLEGFGVVIDSSNNSFFRLGVKQAVFLEENFKKNLLGWTPLKDVASSNKFIVNYNRKGLPLKLELYFKAVKPLVETSQLFYDQMEEITIKYDSKNRITNVSHVSTQTGEIESSETGFIAFTYNTDSDLQEVVIDNFSKEREVNPDSFILMKSHVLTYHFEYKQPGVISDVLVNDKITEYYNDTSNVIFTNNLAKLFKHEEIKNDGIVIKQYSTEKDSLAIGEFTVNSKSQMFYPFDLNNQLFDPMYYQGTSELRDCDYYTVPCKSVRSEEQKNLVTYQELLFKKQKIVTTATYTFWE